MAIKICKAITSSVDGVTSFAPESGFAPDHIIIAPDADDVLWYWDADPNPMTADVTV